MERTFGRWAGGHINIYGSYKHKSLYTSVLTYIYIHTIVFTLLSLSYFCLPSSSKFILPLLTPSIQSVGEIMSLCRIRTSQQCVLMQFRLA